MLSKEKINKQRSNQLDFYLGCKIFSKVTLYGEKEAQAQPRGMRTNIGIKGRTIMHASDHISEKKSHNYS